jgi:hypothetical protein
MSKYIDENAIGEDPSKAAEDDKRLAVRFTTEERRNNAMETRIREINLAHEERAQLLDVASKFDEAKQERANKLPDAPVYRKVEFITIDIPGDKTLRIHRPVMAADKQRFRAKYEAFKNGMGEPTEGTPVEELPEISHGQISELKYVGVTTIEQLAKVSDSSPMMTMMGGVSLKRKAAEWVTKNRKSSVVTQTNEALKERDDKIAKMEEQIAALIASSEAARGGQKEARK